MGSLHDRLTRLILAGGILGGVACGTGSGEEPRTHRVTVADTVTYWMEDGSTQDERPATIQGVVFSQVATGNGRREYPATRNADGTWSAEIPTGQYWAQVTRNGSGNVGWYEVASGGAALDVGHDIAVQRAPLGASTPVTFDVTGLQPWAAGDELRVFGWNVGARLASTPPIPTGDQAGSVRHDWKADGASLLTAGDVLWVTHVRSSAASDGGVLKTVVSATSVTGTAMTDGMPLNVPVAGMADPGAAGALALDRPLSYGRPLPSSWPECTTATSQANLARPLPGTALRRTPPGREVLPDPGDDVPQQVSPWHRPALARLRALGDGDLLVGHDPALTRRATLRVGSDVMKRLSQWRGVAEIPAIGLVRRAE